MSSVHTSSLAQLSSLENRAYLSVYVPRFSTCSFPPHTLTILSHWYHSITQHVNISWCTVYCAFSSIFDSIVTQHTVNYICLTVCNIPILYMILLLDICPSYSHYTLCTVCVHACGCACCTLYVDLLAHMLWTDALALVCYMCDVWLCCVDIIINICI